MAFLIDPVVGPVMEKALSAIMGAAKIIITSKKCGKELDEMLSWLKPIIDDLLKLEIPDSDSSSHVVMQFKDLLKEGLEVVEKIARTSRFDVINRYRYGRRIQKFLKKFTKSIEINGFPGAKLDMAKLHANLKVLDADLRGSFQRLVEIVNASRMTNNPVINNAILQQMINANTTQVVNTQVVNTYVVNNISVVETHTATCSQESIGSSYQGTEIPKQAVDLDNRINDVKQILLQNDVKVVGVVGMGGIGKTTLASTLCNDTQVKGFFQNIIFIPVSSSPNVKALLDTMWNKITGGLENPSFPSIEYAHSQVQRALSSKKDGRILMVLDDVWSKSDLQHLLFEAEGYKTIFTSRENKIIPMSKDGPHREYPMPMLNVEDSLKLFCFWAFGQPSITTTEHEDLVCQVAAECNGLPLALTVIGSCLRDQPWVFWRAARTKLSRAEPIKPDHTKQLLDRLKLSIDVLDDEELKQCFYDLGAFPKGKKFSVDALLDIWVYVRGIEWCDAFVNFLELAKRNLLNFTSDPRSQAISDYDCASGLCFSQHDVMRDLAFRLASQDSTKPCSRFFMPGKEKNIPADWISQKEKTSKAQFVSIHTDAMEEQDWGQIDFPEVEALALFFGAREYCLPTFLKTMPKLKVAIIHNYSSKRAILHGLPSFPLFNQIKSVVVEGLNVSPFYEYCRTWESLEKFSVCLCEGLVNMPLWDRVGIWEKSHLSKMTVSTIYTHILQVALFFMMVSKKCKQYLTGKEQVLKFPNIVEINFDHCSDLEELPVKICNSTNLQKLSVTNCHLFQKLPDDLGNLRSLRVLRLSACPGLSMLPPSIRQLQQLEFLDISLCRSLKDLPMEFEQLSKLKVLDMRECSGLKMLPKALAKLKSLGRVICDENAGRQWLAIKASAMPNLTVEVVEERFNLDWLDD